MQVFTSCKEAMKNCSDTKTFALAHLYKEEKTMDMHIHDCYEIYYSISGGKQFLIDNRFYSINPGDLFIINQYESHKITQIDKEIHERIVLSVHPDYTKKLSTSDTDLDECFSKRSSRFSHKLALSASEQQRFLYLVGKITESNGYGHDLIEQAAFIELMLFIATIADSAKSSATDIQKTYNPQVIDIINFINANITNSISLETISKQFYLSESYICRIFKQACGTTINKYITARRISIAKAALCDGVSVFDAYTESGFTDYSNFYKAFTKAVGMSPKKYSGINKAYK